MDLKLTDQLHCHVLRLHQRLLKNLNSTNKSRFLLSSQEHLPERSLAQLFQKVEVVEAEAWLQVVRGGIEGVVSTPDLFQEGRDLLLERLLVVRVFAGRWRSRSLILSSLCLFLLWFRDFLHLTF